MSFLCSLPLAVTLFSACAAPTPFATGYVEGDYTLIAPVETARIADVAVARGDHVKPGEPLVTMERDDARIALKQAQAGLAQAQSELANLEQGKRPEEIAVIEAELAQAKANAAEADRTEARLESLSARGTVSETDRQNAETAAEVAHAKVAQIEANLKVAQLPGRVDQVAALQAGVAQAKAQVDQAQWKLDQRSIAASQPGVIDDVIRDTGEIAGPSAPVLSFLPDGAVKLRLYVPESDIAQVHVGAVLDVGCDGCEAGQQAKVTYVANGPEFTPPVIYSLSNRQKLVYMIEAKPTGATGLKPGQIVDVRLPGGGQ